ncbi:MAG: hypothetical protein IT461_05385 [Planctomycetes bacterium]|nr:hypothetical protein [Planctomycetota bacterium]
MSKLKFIAALMCLLAAACQSPQSSELLSNEQLMEGLEDGVASETRFLMQHWGARQEFTFSGSSGCSPRDRRAFGRLLCTGDVDYFIKLAHARDPVVAAYGVEGVRILKRQRLPELLPSLLRRYEYVMTLWDDQGHSMSMPALAALALDQVGAETSDAEIARYLDIWLCRIHDNLAESNDEKIAKSFLRLRSWVDLQRLEISAKAREILPALPILAGARYYRENIEGFSREELTALTLPPGSAARRAALQFACGNKPLIVYPDKPTERVDQALKAAREKSFPLVPDPRNRALFEIERLAVDARTPSIRHHGSRGLYSIREIEAFRSLDDATWSYLTSHPNIVVQESAKTIKAHPFARIAKEPPEDHEDLKYWLYRRGHEYLGDDKKAVDRFLAAYPDRFPQTPIDECTNAFFHSNRDMYDDAWFRPNFVRSFDGIPRYWLPFAISARRDLRFHFYDSIKYLSQDHYAPMIRDEPAVWASIMKAIQRDAGGSDLMFKWMAREWLVYFASSGPGGEESAQKFALSYSDELARDYLSQPRIAPVCYRVARDAAAALCKAAGVDYWGEPKSAEKLGTPLWRLLCRILDASPIFDSPHDWPPEHPEWLTLAEMRKLESEPSAFWRELQRDFAALPK